MNKKQMIILIIGTLVIGGLVIFNLNQKGSSVDESTIVKNAEALESKKNMNIVTEEVSYFPGANGYLAKPSDNKTYPGIVMIHENRGLRSETKMAAEQLAKEGYVVLAVDLLGGTAEDQTEARALTEKFKQETGVENMRAAVKYLREQGVTKIASLGWCFGGKQSVELAISGESLDATVVYYGGNMATTADKLKAIKWPVLGIFGDKDQVIPLETVKTFQSSLNTLGITNEIYIYPGVGHAFANPSGMNYAPQETKDAWEKTLVFLEQALK